MLVGVALRGGHAGWRREVSKGIGKKPRYRLFITPDHSHGGCVIAGEGNSRRQLEEYYRVVMLVVLLSRGLPSENEAVGSGRREGCIT